MVIPCHNSLRWLPETLQTVSAQTFEDFEVVLVDDGGDDDLAGWVATLGDDRLRVVRQDNAGVAAARNRGIAEARGELVALLDSDDLWFPHTLASMVERYDEAVAESDGDPPVGLVYGWYQVSDEHGEPVGRVEARRAEGLAWERFVVTNPVSSSAVLMPTEAVLAVGGFEVNTDRERHPIDVEDWDLWIRMADRYRVAMVPRVLHLYRRHGDNSSIAVDSLDAAYRRMLARVFDGQPPRRRFLLPRAVARVEMILGWQSLNELRDARRASAYRRSAVRHHPGARRDVEYWRLGASVAAMALLGSTGYDLVRSGAGWIRRALGLKRS